MSIIWKPGDRAVFGYRPLSELPPNTRWRSDSLSCIGKTGTIKSFPYVDIHGNQRADFLADDGKFFTPFTLCLFPIIEQPPRVQERERELVLK